MTQCSVVPNVLASVHLASAKYYGVGRFDDEDEPNYTKGLFHLEIAARLGIAEAQTALVNIYSGAYNDVLPEAHKVIPSNDEALMEMLQLASNSKVRSAMELLADFYNFGHPHLKQNWRLAADLYLAATELEADDVRTVSLL